MILFIGKQEVTELKCLVAAEMQRLKLKATPMDRLTDKNIRLYEKLFDKLNRRKTK